MTKARKTGVSLPGDLREAAKERAELRHRGNLSAYIQALIAADLAARPAPTSYAATIVADLARTYCGYLAPRLEAALAATKADQPALLHALLRGVDECLAAGIAPGNLTVAPTSP